MNPFIQRLITYIRASIPIIFIKAVDEKRVERYVVEAATSLKSPIGFWSAPDMWGLSHFGDADYGNPARIEDLSQKKWVDEKGYVHWDSFHDKFIKKIRSGPQRTIVFVLDFESEFGVSAGSRRKLVGIIPRMMHNGVVLCCVVHPRFYDAVEFPFSVIMECPQPDSVEYEKALEYVLASVEFASPKVKISAEISKSIVGAITGLELPEAENFLSTLFTVLPKKADKAGRPFRFDGTVVKLSGPLTKEFILKQKEIFLRDRPIKS